jgi:hypothetical protein
MARNEPGAKQGYEQACEDIADDLSIFSVDDALKNAGFETDSDNLSKAVVYLREIVYSRRNKNPFRKKKES